MRDFTIPVLYVRHVLNEADDAELAFLGMAPAEKTAVLEKDFKTGELNHKRFSGAFNPWPSYQQNLSHIKFKSSSHEDDEANTAAHEIFHAAKFWSQKNIYPLGLPAVKYAIGLGVAIGLTGIAMQLQEVQILGAAVIGASCLKDLRSVYKEEVAAYRFGYIFHKDSHFEDSIPAIDVRTSLLDKFKDFFHLGYPSKNKRAHLFFEAKRECLSGNCPRNYALDYHAWRADNIKTTTLES